MITCPDCGQKNIDGADVCERCQKPLCTLSTPRPSSRVEWSVMQDCIEQLVPREPLVISPDVSVATAIQRMVERSVGCAVVVEDHKVVGIFTERDVLMRLGNQTAEQADQPVSKFMTTSVETLELDERVAFALHKMDLGGYRHLPILTEDRVTGIISVRDILNHITAAL